MYGTAPVQGVTLDEEYLTHVSVFTGDSLSAWVEHTALLNNNILDSVAQSNSLSKGANLTSLNANTMTDPNAILYNLILTPYCTAA